jgi:hypothetical protein
MCETLDIDTHLILCKFCVNRGVYCYSLYLRLGYEVIVFSLESRCLQKRERHYWLTKLFDISHLIRALGPCTYTMTPSSYVIWINQPANLLSPLWPLSDTVMQFKHGCDFSPSASPCVIHAEDLRSYLAQYVTECRALFERVCVVSYKSSVHHWFRYYKKSHLLLCVKVEIHTTWFYSRKLSKTERERVLHSKANVSGKKGSVSCAS